MRLNTILSILLAFSSAFLSAQTDWRKIQTVEDVCKAYPEKMQYIFGNMNLETKGLEEVKQAYREGSLPKACTLLLGYYKNKTNEKMLKGVNDASDYFFYKSKKNPAAKQFEQETRQTKIINTADSILQDIYTFQNVNGKVPRLVDGHLKWAHNGPEDDIEWAWALNRHYPVNELLTAYTETGKVEYAEYIDSFIKDWIIQSWPYPGVKSMTQMWRGLEVSFRVKMWAQVFYRFMNTGYISPATRLLILSSLPDHAHYARNFHAQGNWLTMEISGLATVASNWPEYKESKAWMDYSIQTMVASMKEQIYPDGVQTELTSSYHFVALSNFMLFADICKKNDIPLPEYYTKTLEEMYNFLALTMRPDGFGLLNNDADLMNNRNKLLEAAEKYQRDDWKYIASNGTTGKLPKYGPSFIFRWPGQLISRSGYDADAQWSFFDIGPWGSGHQHNDKLHLSVAAYGQDLLVDGGRFAYRGEVAKKYRKYATGSFSHNVILVDGKGQADGMRLAKEPLAENLYAITKDFDYGSGTFDKFTDVKGTFSQTRSMVYVRGKFWIVADQLRTDRPRTIETLWHWHPTCKVLTEKDGIVLTQNKRGNLQIIPVGKPDWTVSLVKGQETPTIQGFYSKEYNTFEPNITGVYSRQLKSDDTFVWVLWPSEGKSPVIQAKILSKDSNSVTVQVAQPGKGSWEIEVPFMNCKNVKVSFVPKK
jgi:hypothetical protein